MPTDPITVVVALRGTAQYRRALERLLTAVQKTGHTTKTLTDLADLALVELGTRHGMRLPRRALPHGSNQHGEPAHE